MLKNVLRVLCFWMAAMIVHAQLLPQQRVLDFENLVALFAKRYAPYDWKKQALGVDLFNIQPWLARVQAAPDDLTFYEIEAEYVAQLQDTHTGFSMTSIFSANLGITVDIYDGRVLIDSINRTVLPALKFPFQIGDEVVSVDGIATADWITTISKWRRFGNPVTTSRVAAGQITTRSQSTFPRAGQIGDTAIVVIKGTDGTQNTYTLPWTKLGDPVTNAGPVPFPTAASSIQAAAIASPQDVLEDLHHWAVPEGDPILAPIPWVLDDDGNPRSFVNGLGSRTPIFRTGFPANFIQRLGRLPSDFHYSGTYQSNGATMGYLRIPNFQPSSTSATVAELEKELTYLQSNTDGLVLDVTRNPGGGCYMLDVAAHLISQPFYFFGEQIRATQSQLELFELSLLVAQLTGADQWIVNTYQSFVDQTKDALQSNRGMTGPIPSCTQTGSTWAPIVNNNPPATIVYTKPMIVLIDEFSISAGEIFPAMLQDNGRGVFVGMRTSGGGGSVSSWPTGFYSESFSTNTNTLVVRQNPIATPEYPTAPYVENIGVRPDVTLDYMTRNNLLTGGQDYVNQFTQTLVNLIQNH
jgi:hypothetical protein